MKKVYFLSIIMFFIIIGNFNLKGQNLIINPSAEIFLPNDCDIADIDLATGYSSPNFATPDYFNCYAPSGLGLSNIHSAQNGVAYVGCSVGYSYEYITGTLLSPLIAGKNYKLKFWIKTNKNGINSTKVYPTGIQGGLGFCFSTTKPNSIDVPDQFSPMPSTFSPNGRVYIPAGHSAYTVGDWTEVSLQYTAFGGENYFTVGEFSTLNLSITDAVYIYWDNFSLVENKCPTTAPNFID